MATTMFFEETIKDQCGKSKMNLEFGRSSYYKEDSLYIVVDGKGLIVDKATALRIIDAMNDVASYLGWNK